MMQNALGRAGRKAHLVLKLHRIRKAWGDGRDRFRGFVVVDDVHRRQG